MQGCSPKRKTGDQAGQKREGAEKGCEATDQAPEEGSGEKESNREEREEESAEAEGEGGESTRKEEVAVVEEVG
jgi:hypothetical protein